MELKQQRAGEMSGRKEAECGLRSEASAAANAGRDPGTDRADQNGGGLRGQKDPAGAQSNGSAVLRLFECLNGINPDWKRDIDLTSMFVDAPRRIDQIRSCRFKRDTASVSNDEQKQRTTGAQILMNKKCVEVSQPSMKSILSPLLGVLVGLLSSSAAADDVVNTTISGLAASKRAAVFQLSTRQVHSFGAFISEDGLALVHLQALATTEKPTVLLADGTSLDPGTVLGILPEPELALLKLNHDPEFWLELASVEPEIGETVALVTMRTNNPWDESVPPVVGPVMAKRIAMTANLRDIQFAKILSLGSGLSAEQRVSLGPGRFAVNQQGQLVAFTAGTSQRRGPRVGMQTLIYLAPVVALRSHIDVLTAEGREIVFPIPADHNPVDLASLDPEFHLKNVAKERQDWAEFHRLMEGLQERHPTSPLIRADLAILGSPQVRSALPRSVDLNAILGTLEADPGETPAHQVSCLSTRADVLMTQGHFDDAIEVLKAAIALSPEGYAKDRFNLAILYSQSGRFAESEALLKELYAHNSDDCEIVGMLGFVLTRQGKRDEIPELIEREADLIRIYSSR